ncbi:urocanate hydratase [Halogeometricum sp. S1BR25-6]|uniref:Probable urocanate hydratase n=1 Tax=Halogeometricum salsisoli TaxID=2950536 RepID=A0ABU2GE22_9EURY|nr:urocanate hydratase [Halogeometricum sp. S1BR25-6]MDS0299050.1 urocanate hydratase [Halogeometricum sp. S1BR25-6]
MDETNGRDGAAGRERPNGGREESGETGRRRFDVGDPSAEWKRYQGSPTGTDIECRGWRQEAALRMLNNNLDPEVAERPEDLVVYGGTGRAARSWDAYDAILAELRELGDEETLLVQSGKPVGRFRTHERAPRVLIANSNLVGKWDNWEHFHELEAEGKMMYGQMTAGSWAYIGTQGILQGTYETLAELGRRHFPDEEGLRGRIAVTGGLGGMGGAQPLAVTMNRGVCIAAEVDEERIDRRIETGYCEEKTDSVAEAVERAEAAAEAGEPYSVGVHGNAADVLETMLERGFVPDVVTDQTSAHDELEGYYPSGYSVTEADALRESDPERYVEESVDTMARHVGAILAMQERGSVAFEYGNNIRGQVESYRGDVDVPARDAGSGGADSRSPFDFPGFVPAYVRPLFCRGKGPFRWAALSGDPADIRRTDDAVLDLFPDDDRLARWISLAREEVQFQGLPARVCWLGYRTDEEGLTERARFALRINELVAQGEISAPIVVTRDHLDAGSVASPHRETEAMRDGTDAVADWPILNALLNCAAGADIVSVHDGGGVGIGNALHANNHIVLDGSDLAAEKARAVFTTDPGMGVIRHADAGYEEALDEAERSGAHVPIPPTETGPAAGASESDERAEEKEAERR